MGTKVLPANKAHLIKAGNYLWANRDGTTRPGVALLDDHRVLQHLTPEQAVELAHQLADAVEAAKRGDAPVNQHYLEGAQR